MMRAYHKIFASLAAIPLVPGAFAVYWLRSQRRQKRPESGPQVLVYSQVIWDDVWQRPQEHARRTAHRYDVLYCCPVQVHNWFYSLGNRWKTEKTEQQDGSTRLQVLSPLILPGHFKCRTVHEINCWIISFYLKLALRGRDHIHSLSNTPFAWPVLHRLFFRRAGRRASALQCLVYDLIDDFIAFDWAPDFGRDFEQKLLQMSDSVITGTRQLAEQQEGAPYIPCGVDYEAFVAPSEPPGELRDLPRPIIGYIGTISERIDFGLLRRVAEKFPAASLVMIGPVHSVDDLPRLPNIHYLGLRPHSRIPAFARAFDVALIPFRISPATVNLHPVKTLEYLAAGVPVVSTALPEVRRFYTDVVTVADSEEEFLAGINAALREPDAERRARGQERAKGASWEVMTNSINSYLFPCTVDESPGARPKEPTGV